MIPPPGDAEIPARRPVWEALSTLFLDTDTSLLRDYRTDILAKSPYSEHELQQILIWEVYPVLWVTSLDVAPEWRGYDPDDLATLIMQRVRRRGIFARLNPGQIVMPALGEWQRTLEGLRRLRAASSSA